MLRREYAKVAWTILAVGFAIWVSMIRKSCKFSPSCDAYYANLSWYIPHSRALKSSKDSNAQASANHIAVGAVQGKQKITAFLWREELSFDGGEDILYLCQNLPSRHFANTRTSGIYLEALGLKTRRKSIAWELLTSMPEFRCSVVAAWENYPATDLALGMSAAVLHYVHHG